MRTVLAALLALSALSLSGSRAVAHCEVPCGIYGDQMRFDMMLEDQATIAKAMVQIRELTGKEDPLAVNQSVRWVMTKEEHATKTMDVIAQYFMAQRIKPGTDEATQAAYVSRLTKAHAVMTAAMKCKQSVADADARALHDAIDAFHQAYEAK